MGLDSKTLERLAKLIEQEHGRGPVRLLLKKITEHGKVGPSVSERLGKLIEREQKRGKSPPEKKLAEHGIQSVIERIPAKNAFLSPAHDYLEWEQMAFDPKTWARIFERLNQEHPPAQLDIVRRPKRNNLPGERRQMVPKPDAVANPRDFLSIAELAERWRCSRGTVYNRLRAVNAQVLDFASRGKRSRKAVSLKTVLEIENRRSKTLR